MNEFDGIDCCSYLSESHCNTYLNSWASEPNQHGIESQYQQLCGLGQLEIHSPDAKHTVILRSKDSATAQAWFSAIHSNVSDLLPRVIAEVREQLGKTGIAGSQEVRHLGWLAEKIIFIDASLNCIMHCIHKSNNDLSRTIIRSKNVFYDFHLQNFSKDYHRSSPRKQIQTGIFLNKYLISNPSVKIYEWFLAKCYNE
nr:PREDICTED: uncharacterized protein LOC103541102 [Equus przewalskii]